MCIRKVISIAVILGLFIGCSTSKNQVSTPDSKIFSMNVQEDPELYGAMTAQARGGTARGVLLPLTDKAVSLAKDALKDFINSENERYTQNYKQARSDLFFYSESSEEHPLDPAGLQFKAVDVLRTAGTDTLIYASFEIDTSRTFEILQNSIFRLKMKDLVIKDTDLPSNKSWYRPWTWFDKPSNTINLDFSIKIFASWIDEGVNIKNNVKVGEFYLTLRDVPFKDMDGYEEYISSVINTEMDGYSYLVPRSTSFQQIGQEVVKTYGHGLYSVEVDVTASRKRGEVSTTAVNIIENSPVLN